MFTVDTKIDYFVMAGLLAVAGRFHGGIWVAAVGDCYLARSSKIFRLQRDCNRPLNTMFSSVK